MQKMTYWKLLWLICGVLMALAIYILVAAVPILEESLPYYK